MPLLGLGQWRCGAGQDANDQADHGRKQGRVLPPRQHAHDAGEAVDAVKVAKVGQKGKPPVDDGMREQKQHRRKVEAPEQHARQHGDALCQEVSNARVAGLGLAAVKQRLLGEDLDAGSSRHETDGDGHEQRQLGGGCVVRRRRQDAVRLLVQAGEQDALARVLRQPQEEAGQRGQAHLGPKGRLGAVLLQHGSPQTEPHLLEAWRSACLEGPVHGAVAHGRERVAVVARRRLALLVARPVGDEGLLGHVSRRLVVSSVARDDVRHDVAVVAVLGELEAHPLEEGLDIALGPFVDGLSVAEEDESVEEVEDLRTGLVDDDDDGDAETRKRLEGSHDGRRRRGIQTARRLVQEDGHGRCRQLHSDAHPLPLSSADDGLSHAADQRVADVGELETVNDGFYVQFDVVVRPGSWQSDARRVDNVFVDGQLGEHDVVLGDVADDLFVSLHLARVVVDGHDTAGVGRLAHQHVDKGRLAGSGTSHDGRESSAIDGARHVLQNRSRAALGMEVESRVAKRETEIGGVGCLAHRIDKGSQMRVQVRINLLPEVHASSLSGLQSCLETGKGVGAVELEAGLQGSHLVVGVIGELLVPGDGCLDATHRRTALQRAEACRRVARPLSSAEPEQQHHDYQEDINQDGNDDGNEECFKR